MRLLLLLLPLPILLVPARACCHCIQTLFSDLVMTITTTGRMQKVEGSQEGRGCRTESPLQRTTLRTAAWAQLATGHRAHRSRCNEPHGEVRLIVRMQHGECGVERVRCFGRAVSLLSVRCIVRVGECVGVVFCARSKAGGRAMLCVALRKCIFTPTTRNCQRKNLPIVTRPHR
jgi:hypothetical protein